MHVRSFLSSVVFVWSILLLCYTATSLATESTVTAEIKAKRLACGTALNEKFNFGKLPTNSSLSNMIELIESRWDWFNEALEVLTEFKFEGTPRRKGFFFVAESMQREFNSHRSEQKNLEGANISSKSEVSDVIQENLIVQTLVSMRLSLKALLLFEPLEWKKSQLTQDDSIADLRLLPEPSGFKNLKIKTKLATLEKKLGLDRSKPKELKVKILVVLPPDTGARLDFGYYTQSDLPTVFELTLEAIRLGDAGKSLRLNLSRLSEDGEYSFRALLRIFDLSLPNEDVLSPQANIRPEAAMNNYYIINASADDDKFELRPAHDSLKDVLLPYWFISRVLDFGGAIYIKNNPEQQK